MIRPTDMMLAAGLLIAALTSEPIGELNEQEFLIMLAQQGFTTGLRTPAGTMKASNAEGAFALQLGFTNSSSKASSIVGEARAIVAFDTPRAIPARQLTAWLTKEAYQGVTAVTLLSGKVRFEVSLATPQSTPEDVVSQARKLQKVGRQFLSAFATSLPKEASDPYRPGPAKYDPEAVMSPIHVQDTDFIAAHFGWNKPPDALMAMRWAGTYARVEGIGFGVHPYSKGLLLITTLTPDAKKVERYLRNPTKIEWAEAQIESGWVSFTQRYHMEGEIKAKDVARIIEQFGRNIKALDIL